MNVLFIICPSLGIGEVYTAVKLSVQLKEKGFHVFFLGNEIISIFEEIDLEKSCVFKKEKKENQQLLEQVVRERKPDLIIFTDYNMYVRNSYMKNPFEIEWIKSFQIPCMIIDTLANCRFHDVNNSIYQKEDRILTIPDWITALLRPVPPNDPKQSKDKRLIYFPVFTESEELTIDQKNQQRESLGISKEKKIVVFPLGHWIPYVAGEVEKRLYENIIKLLIHYFQKLDYEFELILFGDSSWNTYCDKNITVRTDLKNLSFTKTEELIQVSDLVITINRFSNSLGRGAHFHVPVIDFMNRNDIEVNRGTIITKLNYELTPFVKSVIKLVTRNHGMIQRFSIFPEYDNGIMDEFFCENPLYSNIITTCNIFDSHEVIETLQKLLSAEKKDIIRKQREFMKKAYEQQVNLDKLLE